MEGPSHTRIPALAAVVLISISLAWVGAQQTAPPVAIDPGDIGGVVTSRNGPDAREWVIAATPELPTRLTRDVPAAFLTGSAASLEAWDRRTKIGPSGPAMGAFFQSLGEQRKAFADWTDRIAKGETPKTAPPRPAGVERNLVVTLW